MDGIARAVFIIDGNYTRKGFAHLAEHGIEGRFYSMDFVALSDYVASVVEAQTGLRCVFAEKKVYMGSNAQLDSLNQAYYRALDEARFSRSTFTLRSPDGQSAYPTLKEDAVDTTIAFEVAKNFYSVPRDDRFNTLVLYAGDGDLVPVVRGLRSEGVRVLVIYYDFKTATSTTRASQALQGDGAGRSPSGGSHGHPFQAVAGGRRCQLPSRPGRMGAGCPAGQGAGRYTRPQAPHKAPARTGKIPYCI